MGRSIGNLKTQGLPMPIVPTENTGIMSGSMRKKREGRRRDERGSRSDIQLGRVTQPDGSTLITYGPNPRRRERRMPRNMRLVPKETFRDAPDQPRFDPTKPSAVMETERVNVQDPTLGGPPEREVPMPRERDTSPRGQAPFSPDERAMARDAFFEKMFSRADERKQQKAMRKEERMNTIQSMRDEDRNTAVDRRRGEIDTGGEINLDAEKGRGRRGRRGRGMRRRRDFTRRRSQMEGRRSREERAAFRDRFVSTLR